MSWSIRPYEERDAPSLTKHLKGTANLTPEEWKWKYFGYPRFEDSIWVVEAGGSIIGHIGLMGCNAAVGGSVIGCCQAVDLFIIPEYRRKGIFVELGKKALDSAGRSNKALAIGFPNYEALGGHKKYGWKELGLINRALKPLDAGAYAADKFPDSKLKRLALGRKMKKYVRRERPPEGGIEIDRVKEFGPGFDAFFEKFSKESGLNAAARTAEHLTWRYLRHPTKEFKILKARKGDEMSGYAVGLVNDGKAYIMDMLADTAALQSLIYSLEEEFIKARASVAYAWTPGIYADTFKRMAYMERPAKQYFIVRDNSGGLPESAFDFNKWFITMGDSDLH